MRMDEFSTFMNRMASCKHFQETSHLLSLGQLEDCLHSTISDSFTKVTRTTYHRGITFEQVTLIQRGDTERISSGIRWENQKLYIRSSTSSWKVKWREVREEHALMSGRTFLSLFLSKEIVKHIGDPKLIDNFGCWSKSNDVISLAWNDFSVVLIFDIRSKIPISCVWTNDCSTASPIIVRRVNYINLHMA